MSSARNKRNRSSAAGVGRTKSASRARKANEPHRAVRGGSTAPRDKGATSRGEAAPPIVGFVSLGCSKNLVDSEKMLGQIAESGAIITADETAADTIVVNTCGFLSASRDEGLAVLRELAERKKRGELQRIVVAGCLVQRDGAKLTDEIPEIDALVGVNNRDDVPAAVWGTRSGAGESANVGTWERKEPPAAATAAGVALPTYPPSHLPTQRPDARHQNPARRAPGQGPPLGAAGSERAPAPLLHLGDYYPQPWNDRGRLRLTPRHYAYLRISEGCNQKCTFCTIPSIRGPMHCKPPDELVAEGRELIADGVRELILIGQDTTSYGLDIGYDAGLAGLLRHLNRHCDAAEWIRLMYVYPSVFTDEMIDAIASCERVVKYIDIPLQHISDRMLKAMGRRVTRPQQISLLEKLRTRIPGVTIRTTFIVGFPGETEADIAELVDFVKAFEFDAVGAFRYSFEPETPSGRMKDQLEAMLKDERYERLMQAQQETVFNAARRRIGKTFKIVVDGPGLDGASVGRHAGQAPEVDGVCKLPSGDFDASEVLTVRCVETDGYDLVVQPVARALPVM